MNDYLPCPHCKNTGMKTPDCGMCDAAGWIDDPDDGGTMMCPYCDGEVCHLCGGDKFVAAPIAESKNLQALLSPR